MASIVRIMVDEILSMISQGQMPPVSRVEKWLGAALTKKLGVINLPPQFWHVDIKINPSTKHLLWAAVLTEDRKRFAVAEGILHAEIAAGKYKQERREQENDQETGQRLINEYLTEMLMLSTHRDFNDLLTDKIQKTVPPQPNISPHRAAFKP